MPNDVCAVARQPGSNDTDVHRAWHDTSPHREISIAAGNGITLNVLDWAGDSRGTPVLWIAGANSSAHVFDDIAPRLRSSGRQLGLTPRGQAPSSIPDSAYSMADRIGDVLAVLDSLRLPRVVLVGHSLAGDLLTGMAAWHPERVAGLVYLDAAYDRSTPYPPPPREVLSHAHPAGAATVRDFMRLRCSRGPLPSPAEISEAILQWNLVSALPLTLAQRFAIHDAHTRRENEAIRAAAGYWPGGGRVSPPRVPVILLYALHASQAAAIDALGINGDSTALKDFFDWWNRVRQPLIDAQRRAAAHQWPNAIVVVRPAATHAIMWSDPEAVEHAVRSVLARIRQ